MENLEKINNLYEQMEKLRLDERPHAIQLNSIEIKSFDNFLDKKESIHSMKNIELHKVVPE
jgi:hypothetical protein